jgi:hypothetical protein
MWEGRASWLKLVIVKLFNNPKPKVTGKRLCCTLSECSWSHIKFSCHVFLELSKCHCFLYAKYA